MITVPDDDRFFLDCIRYLDTADSERVMGALAFGREMHAGVCRKSGEAYITHPMTVAYYLTQYQLDAPAIIAAILHDVAEDTIASVSEISERYGDDVGQIVDGLTKVEEEKDSAKKNRLANQEATHNKLFRMMIANERIALIKIMDRLHNLRTMDGMSQKSKREKANETLNVYAPLARRLGMWQIYIEMTAKAVYYLAPDVYTEIMDVLAKREEAHKPVVQNVKQAMMSHYKQYGVESLAVYLSPRSVYSVYLRWQAHGGEVRVDDIPRIVVVVPNPLDCYTAMGVAHKMWSHRQTQFTDNIGGHTDNLYRALHTTVITNRRLIKLRFRTPAMQLMSDLGVLNLWSHKTRTLPPLVQSDVRMQVQGLMQRFRDAIEQEASTQDMGLDDVLARQIIVFTPSGEPKEMPRNATPIDFAYSVHSAIGDSCYQTFVNGELWPLNHALKDGDIVEIKSRSGQTPNQSWLIDELGYVTTSRARKRIRAWFRKLPAHTAIAQGQKILDAELHMLGFSEMAHEKIARLEGYVGQLDMYLAIGRGEKPITDISTRMLVRHWNAGKMRQRGHGVASDKGEHFVVFGAGRFSQLMLCRNCKPRPADKVVGFIRKNETVTVHHETCHQLPTIAAPSRMLQLRWGKESNALVRLVNVYISVNDRPGLIYEISRLFTDEQVNIVAMLFPYDDLPRFKIEIEVQTPHQLVMLLHRIRRMANITDVRIGHEYDENGNK